MAVIRRVSLAATRRVRPTRSMRHREQSRQPTIQVTYAQRNPQPGQLVQAEPADQVANSYLFDHGHSLPQHFQPTLQAQKWSSYPLPAARSAPYVPAFAPGPPLCAQVNGAVACQSLGKRPRDQALAPWASSMSSGVNSDSDESGIYSETYGWSSEGARWCLPKPQPIMPVQVQPVRPLVQRRATPRNPMPRMAEVWSATPFRTYEYSNAKVSAKSAAWVRLAAARIVEAVDPKLQYVTVR
jgi:hypothetical protein